MYTDRWRAHCKKVVEDYWDKELIQAAETTTLKYLDTDYASTRIPMRIWQMAGLCSDSVKQTTIVNWMLLGVYFTRELLHKMKKSKSAICLGCDDQNIENLNHLILHCSYYNDIREAYLPKFFSQNKNISKLLNNEDLIILSILDPLSSKLPESVVRNWLSPKQVYKFSRQFCYNLHRKREKLYSDS